MSDLITACMAFTGPLEENILWPYRDNAKSGNATVGYGHLLYSPLYASNVFGVPLDTLQPQWDDLMKAEAGKRASFYETVTNLRLTPAQSDELFRSDMWCHIDRCQRAFPATVFNGLPQPVQIACVDISFNVGSITKFPHFMASCGLGDWPQAAVESNRPQLPARSALVRELILSVLAPAIVT